MKKTVHIILAVVAIFLLSHCSDKPMTKYPFSPRQAKKIFSAKSSASASPNQIKNQSDQSVTLFAPEQPKRKYDIQSAKQSNEEE